MAGVNTRVEAKYRRNYVVGGLVITVSLAVIVVTSVTLSVDRSCSCNGVSPPPNISVALTNITTCAEAVGLPLGKNVRVTACMYLNTPRIDIRKFVNGKPTRIGIGLEIDQWIALKEQMQTIDRLLKTRDGVL